MLSGTPTTATSTPSSALPDFTRAPETMVAAFARASVFEQYGYTFLDSQSKPTRYSFRSLWAAAEARGRALLAMGFKRGERVAMVLSQPEDFVVTFLGCLVVGLVPVPMFPPLSFGKLDAYADSAVNILTTAAASALVTDKQLQNVLWQVMPRVKTLKKLLLADALADAPRHDGPLPVITPDDLAFLQFTSGSTSAPKGVMVTHGNLVANCNAIATEGMGLSPGSDVAVSWLPLYHDMGLIGFVLTPLIQATDVVFIPTLSFVRRPNLWLQTLHDYKGSLSFGPNFAYALASKKAGEKEKAAWDLSRVRLLGCGAEPIHPDVMREFTATFAKNGLRAESLMPAYGMAEATLAISFWDLDKPVTTLSADAETFGAEGRVAPPVEGRPALTFVNCGRAFDGHELRVVDADGNTLGEGMEGEILLRGPSVCAGYWQNPEATAASFADGWLRTGDLGFLLDGNVFITGRCKDLIILNGRNYHPQTIEWSVQDVEGVRRGNVVAFARPGKDSEELVVALEAKPDHPADLADRVKDTVAEQLSLKVADVAIVGVGQLPKTSSGKLQRRKTREQYLAGVLGQEGVRTLGSTGETLTVARHVARSLLGRAQHTVTRIFSRDGGDES